MAIRISLDNGANYYYDFEIEELISELDEHNLWDVLLQNMDDEIYKLAQILNDTETPEEFLQIYMENATEDLIVG